MTHFTVGIIVPPKELGDIEAFIETQMAPYDEDHQVSPYVCYSVEQAEADIARQIARFEQALETQDPRYNLPECERQLAKLRLTTPGEKYQEFIARHEQFDDEGEPVSTYNPNSKWDWYVIGGRWDGWIDDRKTSREAVSDNIATTKAVLKRAKIPHAIITPDGQWHEQGQMGWWGAMLTENEDWEPEAASLLRKFPKHFVVIVDAHI